MAQRGNMGADANCSWKPSAEPAVYDCRAASLHLPLWSKVCSKAAAKYEGHQPDLQRLGLTACNGTHSHAHRMLRQLHGRTVAVLGDSHALNLWCALTCWFSSAPGVQVERRDQPGSLSRIVGRKGRLANFSYDITHVEEGQVRSRVAWMLPSCYTASGNRCGDPTSMTARPIDECSLPLAEKLVAAADEAGERVVVLFNPCGVYFGDPMVRAVSKFMRGNDMEPFAGPSNLIKTAMQGVTMDATWRKDYNQRVGKVAKVLARLRNGSAGILVESAVRKPLRKPGSHRPFNAQRCRRYHTSQPTTPISLTLIRFSWTMKGLMDDSLRVVELGFIASPGCPMAAPHFTPTGSPGRLSVLGTRTQETFLNRSPSDRLPDAGTIRPASQSTAYFSPARAPSASVAATLSTGASPLNALQQPMRGS